MGGEGCLWGSQVYGLTYTNILQLQDDVTVEQGSEGVTTRWFKGSMCVTAVTNDTALCGPLYLGTPGICVTFIPRFEMYGF